MKDKSYYVQLVKFYDINNNLERTINLKTTLMLKGKVNRERFYNQIIFKLAGDSNGEWIVRKYIKEEKGNYVTIENIAFRKIEKVVNVIEQVYRLNNTLTCVYDGFLKFFESVDKNKKKIYNRLIKEKNKYAKAYTDETLNEICNFTQSNLTIRNLINGNDKKFYAENARYNIEFINTKYNHLDLTTHSYNKIIELNDISEYNQIKKEQEFYIESMGKLITLENTYKIKDNEFKLIYNEWKNKYNYNDLLIEDTNDELKLINEYDYSTHCFFNNFEVDNNLYNELDIEKAYFNYSNKDKNIFYHGVPSGGFINFKCENEFNIKIFDEQLKNKLIGFYQVQVIKIHNNNKLYYKLGITENTTHVFTSVQINNFKNDIEFNFLNLSISPAVDIPFNKEFINEVDGLKHYCKAYGLMNCISSEIKYTIKPLICDINYFSIIQNENLNIYEYDGLIHVINKNENIKTATHIFNYIHSYTKNLIFEQLKNVDIDDVFGVKLDSIVIKKGAKINKILNCFHDIDKKTCNIENMLGANKKANKKK